MSSLWVTTDELGAAYANNEFAYEACKMASQILWAFSGRKFNGTSTVTERYRCSEDLYPEPLSALNPFEGLNHVSARLTTPYTNRNRLRLRGGPVAKIHSVRDRFGNIVDPSYYYLTDFSTLQPHAGRPWVPCDIEVTYTYGSPPPAAGKAAARILALEIVKSFSGATSALPSRVTSISRQGVTYTILDDQDFLDNMRTGIYLVDLFLKMVNPSKAIMKSKVFSPDMPRGHRVTAKPLPLPASLLDLTVSGKDGGTLDVNLAYINAAFLVDGSGWVPSIKINSTSGTSTDNLGSAVVTYDAYVTDRSASAVNFSVTNNVALITTSTAHRFTIGDAVIVNNIPTTGNLSTHYITGIPSTTSFTYALVHADTATTAVTSSPTVTAVSHDKLTITLPYAAVYSMISFADPGTWDLYATKGVDTVYIASGNLSIALGGTTSPTYVIN
jgi:hypothetical protein